VKPVDVIEEMFTNDAVASEWEVLRWRRLKLSLIRARALKALEGFLRDKPPSLTESESRGRLPLGIG